MIKRTPKTDEQLYIDWASEDVNWLENMPLNKANLERYKKTIDFALRKMSDSLGVFANAFCDQPEVKALQKLLEYKAPAKGVITKTDLNEKEYAKLKAAFTKKNSVPCSQEEGTL